MSVENTDHLNNFFINLLSDHQQNIGKIQNFTLLSNYFYVTQLLQIHGSLSQPPRFLSVNTLGYILNKLNSINKDTLPVDQNASSFLNKYYIHSFENELPSYDLVTRIIQNSIKQVNEVPILVDDTILRFPSFIDKVVSLHYPSLSTVEQVNSSIESQTTQNGKRFRFHILYVQDEAKTIFTCTKCTRQWTSMKGSISFLVVLSTYTTGQLQVDCMIIKPGANVFSEIFPQEYIICQNIC
ncbi:unnamed protein product [Schistosoma rodhaini]|uniref:Uncharacterized protein n=1 Tax=Schistosoma rodhaini TaxID=6188 RepID=A0AA85FJM7_9TREM|nr:unnamed protein product [Schistosoma rodhaini]